MCPCVRVCTTTNQPTNHKLKKKKKNNFKPPLVFTLFVKPFFLSFFHSLCIWYTPRVSRTCLFLVPHIDTTIVWRLCRRRSGRIFHPLLFFYLFLFHLHVSCSSLIVMLNHSIYQIIVERLQKKAISCLPPFQKEKKNS